MGRRPQDRANAAPEPAPDLTGAEARPAHRPSRRPEVIEAATRVFARLGPDASVAEIATEAGMAPAAIYYHFDSKDQLLGAVLEHVSQEVTSRTRDESGQLHDILTATRNVWEWMESHENEARLLYLWMVPSATEADLARRRFFERHVLQSSERLSGARSSKRLTVLERLAARTVITLTLKVSIARLTDDDTRQWSTAEIVEALANTQTQILTAPSRAREFANTP